jgi:hypothetical protein
MSTSKECGEVVPMVQWTKDSVLCELEALADPEIRASALNF